VQRRALRVPRPGCWRCSRRPRGTCRRIGISWRATASSRRASRTCGRFARYRRRPRTTTIAHTRCPSCAGTGSSRHATVELRLTVELARGTASSKQLAERIAASVRRELERVNSEFANYVPSARRSPRARSCARSGTPSIFRAASSTATRASRRHEALAAPSLAPRWRSTTRRASRCPGWVRTKRPPACQRPSDATASSKCRLGLFFRRRLVIFWFLCAARVTLTY